MVASKDGFSARVRDMYYCEHTGEAAWNTLVLHYQDFQHWSKWCKPVKIFNPQTTCQPLHAIDFSRLLPFWYATYRQAWAALSLEVTEKSLQQMWFPRTSEESGWRWLLALAHDSHSPEHCSCTGQSENCLSRGPEANHLWLQACV